MASRSGATASKPRSPRASVSHPTRACTSSRRIPVCGAKTSRAKTIAHSSSAPSKSAVGLAPRWTRNRSQDRDYPHQTDLHEMWVLDAIGCHSFRDCQRSGPSALSVGDPRFADEALTSPQTDRVTTRLGVVPIVGDQRSSPASCVLAKSFSPASIGTRSQFSVGGSGHEYASS